MDREFLIGIELTNKTISAGLVDLSGKIVKRASVPSEVSKGKKKVVENIISTVKKIQKNKVLGIGISIPGIVNREKGLVVESPWNGWNSVALKKLVEEQVHIPVFLENEGNCFAIAEYKCGYYKKTENTIGVLFNDAISSGLIVDGRLAKGCSFAAGAVNNSVVDSKKTTLQDQASVVAIEKQFKQKTRKSKNISEIINMNNDKKAKDILKAAGSTFGTSMSHLVNALNPEIIIVGGPLSKSDTFISAAQNAMVSKTNELCGRKVKIVGSKLNDSGILGASSIVV